MMVRAVQSLLQQTAAPEDYEVIIIDNGSTDGSQEVARSMAESSTRVRVRLVEETRTGIAFARNTSFEEASGEYVASIDDDAAAEPDWIARIIDIIRTEKSPPIAIGGKYIPLYEVPKPSWFLDSYEIRTWGEERRYMRRGESFAASNMVVRKDAFMQVGGFPTNVGMSGDKLMIGEEPLLFERLWDKLDCEGRIVYDPDLHVRHSVPAFKMKLTAMARRRFVAGQFAGRMIKASGSGRFVATLRSFVVIFVKIVYAFLLIFKIRNVQRWIFEGLGHIAEPVARFLCLIGWEPKMKRI